MLHVSQSLKRAVRATAIGFLAVAAVIPAQVCLAKDADKPTAPKAEYLLKVVYLIPTNRQPEPQVIPKIKNYIKWLQQYYSLEMARWGFYKPGTTEGKTFVYEADENGDPIVHMMKGKKTDVEYKDGLVQFPIVADEVQAVFPSDHTTLIVWTECCKMNADSTISGPSCLGSGGEPTGQSGGIAIMGSDGFAFLNPNLFNDTTPIEGLTLPEVGPYPIKHHVSYGGFANPTIGGYASTICGATGHELGHAFRMPHCFVNDDAPKIGGDIMGRGNQGIRGNYGNYPGEWAHIAKLNCEILNVSPYFNPGKIYKDKKAPMQVADVYVENSTLKIGRHIHINVQATDRGGSGLWRSLCACCWSMMTSAPFDANGVADYDLYPYQVPIEELKPNSYLVELYAIDNDSNWIQSEYWVTMPETVAIQCPDGEKWYDVPSGCIIPSSKIRLAMSMNSLDKDVTLTPEVEVRPIGEPFTGKPNYKGESAAYKDKAVMGYVYMELPDGPYACRYRLVDQTGKKSGWVYINECDPLATDFRIKTK